jgi:hypothetical protein
MILGASFGVAHHTLEDLDGCQRLHIQRGLLPHLAPDRFLQRSNP